MEVVKDRIGNLDVRYHAKQTHECDSVKDDTATTTTTTTTTRRDDHKRLKSMQHKIDYDNKHDDDNDDDDDDVGERSVFCRGHLRYYKRVVAVHPSDKWRERTRATLKHKQ